MPPPIASQKTLDRHRQLFVSIHDPTFRTTRNPGYDGTLFVDLRGSPRGGIVDKELGNTEAGNQSA